VKRLNHNHLSVNDVQAEIRKKLAGRYVKALKRTVKPMPAQVDYRKLSLRELRRVAIEHLALIYGPRCKYSVTARQPWLTLDPITTAAAITTVQAVVAEIGRRTHLSAEIRQQTAGQFRDAILFWLN
jgi:hypothetical protein